MAVLRLGFGQKSVVEDAYPIGLVEVATLTKFVEFTAIVEFKPVELRELMPALLSFPCPSVSVL